MRELFVRVMSSYQKMDLIIKFLILIALVVIIYFLYNIELTLRPIGEQYEMQNSVMRSMFELL